MAVLVQVVKKIYHLIESNTHVDGVIVQVNYLAIKNLVKQILLTTSLVDKLNPRLIRALQYLSQFNLDIRYRPGKEHIVANALSQLPTQRTAENSTSGVLDDLTVFYVIVVELSQDFK